MAAVCIVVPPVLSVARPNLGVGLLKAALLNRGIDCDAYYANIAFAGEFGCGENEMLAEKIDTRPLLAEWLFSWALFPERDAARDRQYLAYARKHVADSVLSFVTRASNAVGAFVDATADAILERDPRIVGVSTSFQQNTAALAIARSLKQRRPDVVTCLGGANCEGAMGEALARNFTFVDHVFSGESDNTFPTFAAKVLAGEPTPSRVLRGAPVHDLDALPTPDYADYFAALHEHGLADEVQHALVFEGSRGCWWGAKHHCKFCGLNGTSMGYRAKSPSRVRAELGELHTRWGSRSFMAADNILDHRSIDELFSPDEEAQISLFYEVKANLTHAQLMRLAQGGVRWIQPGVESLDDEVLATMDKGVSALQNIRLLRSCAEVGVVPIWNLLRGFPGEGDVHHLAQAAMVPFIEHLSPPRGPFPIRLDRFSPYFEQAEDYGFSGAEPMRGYRAIYPLPPEELRDLAYFYEDPNLSETSSPALERWASAVAQWRARHFSDRGAPVLSLIELGEGNALVRDTRSASVREFDLLDAHELEVMRWFRDPRPTDSGIEKLALASGRDAPAVATAFARLVEARLILVDRGKALSLALDYKFSCDVRTDNLPHPFGEWKPRRAAPQRASPRMFNRGHA